MLSSRPLSAANSLASGGQAGFPSKGAQASSAAPLKAGVLGCKSVNSTCCASGSSVLVMGQPSKGMPLKVVVEQQHQAHQHQGPSKTSLHAPQHPPFKPHVCRHAMVTELESLHQEFERMRVFAISSAEGQEEDVGSKERIAQIEFVLKYIAQVIETVQAASDEQLPQLELQIKTSLLPLKESIAGQMGASSASSSSDASVTGTVSSISVEEPQQEVAADVLTAPPGPVDDAWMSECSAGEASSAASDASGEVEGLDELDFECFSVIMEEEAAAAAHHTQPRVAHAEMELGTASLSVEDEARAMLKRPFEAVAPMAGEAVVEDEMLAKKRSLSVSMEAPKARVQQQGQQQVQQQQGGSEQQKPRTVDYQCGLCSEVYKSTTALNPWVALEQQECPKCKKIQIPRIDITMPSNIMDYHPALLAEEGDDDSDDEGCGDDLTREEEEQELDDFEEEGAMAAHQAARLMVLMGHARTCPGLHKSPEHAEVCRATKFLMLHIRDCDGKTLDGDSCSYPWCKAGKLLLNHLVRCYEPDKCACCSLRDLPHGLENLRATCPGAGLSKPQPQQPVLMPPPLVNQPLVMVMDESDAAASRASDLIFGTGL